jgi:hypothetical protein
MHRVAPLYILNPFPLLAFYSCYSLPSIPSVVAAIVLSCSMSSSGDVPFVGLPV